MSNFTIEGRKLATAPDIQRTWLWEWVILGIGNIAPDGFGLEDLIIRCRSTSIPSRGNEVIESNFMSMKQYFMGKPIIESTIATQFEEFEDQKIMQFLYSWRQAIFNIGPKKSDSVVTKLVGDPGSAARKSSKRKGLSKTCYLRMYAFNGDLLPYSIKFINAWPENVESVSLDYAGGESVKYNVTWRFDFWQLIKN
jgi:hypothetical protein